MRLSTLTSGITFVAVCLCAALPARAISLGVGPKGGLNLGNADVEGEETTEGRQGLAVGGMVELGVTSPYSLLVEPMYVQTGARFDLLGATTRGDFDYLEVPILLKAKFGKIASHAYLIAGPNIGFNLAAEGRWGNVSDEIKDQAASVVFAGDIGLGGAFAVSQFVYLSADVRYSHGFTNALDETVAGVESWMKRDIRIMAGAMFHLIE
jgi:hypothetical protein